MNDAKKLGVKVGLGTDVAGGYSPSMLSALRSAVVTSKALRMQHLAPAEHGTEPSPANSHLLDYKVGLLLRWWRTSMSTPSHKAFVPAVACTLEPKHLPPNLAASYSIMAKMCCYCCWFGTLS